MKSTEQDSLYDKLEEMSTAELIASMNTEDRKVPQIVGEALPEIEALIDAAFKRLSQGGRLIYMGSGTSGRLGILDASECPPTFGVDPGRVVGLIAGGKEAVYQAVEHAEDSLTQGWLDLKEIGVNQGDVVVGITASGTTPYVLGAIKACKGQGILTGGISCNQNSPLSSLADHSIELVVGPEFVTGSTRMKSGTAQKLVLNMISTSLMIKMGHVRGSKMIDMQLSNAKLVDRGSRMIQEATDLTYEEAREALLSHGSVRKALEMLNR